MIIEPTPIAGAYTIGIEPIADARGFFARTWCRREIEQLGLCADIAQCSISVNPRKGTLRGMHLQGPPHEETKIVRCVKGSIFDVVLDLRRDSPTFLRWHGETLTAANARMLFVPEGCAHGCLSLEDDTEIYYLTSAIYAPASVRGVRFDDPAIGVRWPVAVSEVSEQDGKWPPIDTRGARND